MNNNFDWNDDELINYWELAQQEYLKYYSIKKTTPIASTTSTTGTIGMGPNTTDSEISQRNAVNINQIGTVNNAQTKSNRKDARKRIKTTSLLPITGQLSIKSQEVIKKQMSDYYSGFKDGLMGGNGGMNEGVWYQLGLQNSRLE